MKFRVKCPFLLTPSPLSCPPWLQLNPDSALFLNMVKNISPAQYAAAQRIRARAAKHFEAVFQKVDVILTPTVPVQAPLLPAGHEVAGEEGMRILEP
jgi:Asp-tRNA(Asn)/Glu-tRNA(Gln) amidotransferase A subunit family amidase